jgi:hypothetical protein
MAAFFTARFNKPNPSFCSTADDSPLLTRARFNKPDIPAPSAGAGAGADADTGAGADAGELSPLDFLFFMKFRNPALRAAGTSSDSWPPPGTFGSVDIFEFCWVHLMNKFLHSRITDKAFRRCNYEESLTE